MAARGGVVSDPRADGLLYLLRAEPTLLPPAPESNQVEAIEHRRKDEVHACLRCGARAQSAYIAATEIGPRWVDLCMICSAWLRENAT